ncbi:MAG TPA: endo-1,4-beta-xylanase, partial [Terriglobales bacterium]|nr:endo-1,4-beta-xylanase [Terriglobales bacterium]
MIKTPHLLLWLVLLLAASMISCGGGNGGGFSSNPSPTVPTLRSNAAIHNITVGAAADSGFLSESQYAAILGSEFSQLEPENEMKFGLIHPRPDSDPNPYDFSGADALVSFAQAHNMVVRGHTMVWHNQVPDWLTNGISGGTINSTQLSTILQNHIQTVMTHYSGKVYAWDVVNEAFNDVDGTVRSTLWYDSPGIGFQGQGTKYIEQAFNWAHTADPNAKLFYNDYNDETMNAKSDAIYAMAADFKNRGVPLSGIGFQMHWDLGFDNPVTLTSFTNNLQRFAALGMELHITELDIKVSDTGAVSLAAQAH